MSIRQYGILLLLFAAIVGMNACKPSPGKAEAYYNEMLDHQQAVMEKEDILIRIINKEMAKTLGDSVNANIPKGADSVGNSKELDLAFADFCLQIKESSAGIAEMGSFDGSTRLFDAGVSLIETYRKLSENEYKEVVEIVKIPASEYGDEDDNRFLDLTVHIDTCLAAQIEEFTRVCKEFSRDYQFTIVDPAKEKP
jgi:hypothetical protein